MEPFTTTFNVKEKDIDILNHVNNISYLKWVQEVSASHWYSITTKEIQDQYYWVVLRHEIDYYHPTFFDEVITAVTWIGESEGVKSDRFVHFYCKDKLVSRVKTTWCLIDKVTKKPTKITDDILAILEPFKM